MFIYVQFPVIYKYNQSKITWKAFAMWTTKTKRPKNNEQN